MPDEEPVVWPDDPVEGEPPAEAVEPAKPKESSWPTTFEEALSAAQHQQEPAAAAPVNEYPTQHSMPAMPAKEQLAPATAEVAKTAPPEPAKPEPAVAAEGTGDEMPTSSFKTPIPAPVSISAANGGEAAPKDVAPAETELPEAKAEAVPEPATELEPEPLEAVEVEPAAEAPPEPESAAQPEPQPEPKPEPQAVPAEGAVVPAQEPAPEPVKAAEPEPAPKKEEEWIPLPVNPPVPSWAPKLGATEPAAAQNVDWPGSNLPAWAPIAGGRPTASMPAATRISSTPSTPAASQPPKAAPAQTPSQPPAPAAASSQPPASEPPKGKTSSWEIVQPKSSEQAKPYLGPSAEDKSYAEWFAWAKRSGAPATACHAAAQGAFRALAAGHDMNTAVNWATVAMASPPGLVSASRQLYCAWYSLGNIDLKLPSPQAHSFAAGAIAALEGGADAPTAHQAGLAAAGIIG